MREVMEGFSKEVILKLRSAERIYWGSRERLFSRENLRWAKREQSYVKATGKKVGMSEADSMGRKL